ncbi:hypothetical protein B0G74_7354 [Paraburkholderia sp. BL9I2N2]|jgi:hypothetical protein|nr:hypothetical protein B0G74_7354 [Paraburkholderia sp. BL9I2N2]
MTAVLHTPMRRQSAPLTDRREVNLNVKSTGVTIIVKLIFSQITKAIVSMCAIQKLDIIVCSSAEQEIPYVMLFTMYGFV